MSALEILIAATGTFFNTRSSYQPTRFVWSRGLALLCDHNGGLNFVRRQPGGKPAVRFPRGAYGGIRDGDLVWVRSVALPQFVSEVLPAVQARFALVTGDEDWNIPYEFKQHYQILENSNVACWFAQNFDGSDSSGKLFPIPIGLDFHTISNGPKWGHSQSRPAYQENELERLRAQMPPNKHRQLRVHADFHLNVHRWHRLGERRDVIQAALSDNPNVDFQTNKIKRLDIWRKRTEYAFVVSPHGNGLDCHRTWESLALDNIVIVKRSSLDPLYDGLPVVIINDWNEITTDNLTAWHEQFSRAFADPAVQERLTNSYWINRARRILAERMATNAS